MDISIKQRPSHKDWRQRAKKERRKRLRRRAAQERDAEAERLRLALEKSAGYLNWLKEQNEKELEEKRIIEEKRLKNEREWLERELKAQEEWKALQIRRDRELQEKLEKEEIIRKENEAKLEAVRKKEKELEEQKEEEIRRRQVLKKQIDDYIDSGEKTPEILRKVVETQPGKEICQFYAKTGACRYGDLCSKNHQKLSLSRVILIPGFYFHYSLEKNSHDTEAGLEFENYEKRQHFKEFYREVVPELETFGKIKTLRFCSNTEPHLRGNLYIEYSTEREAARALRKLNGRWFEKRQLNCEFTGITSWRSAICGVSVCPRGKSCNFLHVFRNPGNEYDIPPRRVSESSRRSDRHRLWDESVRGDNSKNWRWDSPDIEDSKDENTRRNYSEDRCPSSRRSNHEILSRSRNHIENRARDSEDSDGDYRQKQRRNSREYKKYQDSRRSHRYSSRNRRSRRSKHRSHDRFTSRERVNREDQKSSRTSRTKEDNHNYRQRKNSLRYDSHFPDSETEKKLLKSVKSDSSSSSESSDSSSPRVEGEKKKADEIEIKSRSKRQKISDMEYYQWDTTDSEDEVKK